MKYLLSLIAILIIIAAIVFGLGYWTQQSASYEYQRGQAQALVLQAQGQARLDSALAFGMLSNAALPWAVVLMVSGGVITAGLHLMRQPARGEPARIVERYIVALPEPQVERLALQLSDKIYLLSKSQRKPASGETDWR